MEIQFGKTFVGDAHQTAFVGEAGSFFNKDIKLAEEYIKMCSEAGVDIFKTEILHSPEIVLDKPDFNCTYNTSSGKKNENYRKFIERKVLPLSEYQKLFDIGQKYGAQIIATVFDQIGVDFLVQSGAVGIKISRNNLKHKSLIKYAALSGLPILFDLGDVPFWTAMRAQDWVVENGGACMFNHHPGINPAPANSHNLRVISRFKEMFRTPIGLSCHYKGEALLYTAVGCGVNLIEKGIDYSPDRDEADLVSSVSFDKLSETVKNVRLCSEAMGKKDVQIYEERHADQMTGIITACDIKKGEIITLDKISFAWPPVGIESEYVDLVIDSVAKQSMVSGIPLNFSDIYINK